MMPSRGFTPAQSVRLGRRLISTTSPRNAIQSPLPHRNIANGTIRKSSIAWKSQKSALIGAAAVVSGRRHASWSFPQPNDAGSTINAVTSRVPAVDAAVGPAVESNIKSSVESAAATVSDVANNASSTASGLVSDASAEVTSKFDNFDISHVTDTFLATMPEQIGYLKAIGLDYGWGPTAMIEWLIEHVHIYSGMPWWGSIAASSVLLRVLLIPMFTRSSEMGARMQCMQPVVKPLGDKMTAAMKAGDSQTAMQTRTQLSQINKDAGISYPQMFVPMLLQGVFGFCAFRLMRAMAKLPVPGLETGGFAWMTDLTHADPYMVLPAVLAGSMHVIFRFGGESGMSNPNPQMKSFTLYVFPAIIFLTTTWLPACLNIWLAAGGIMGLIQTTVLKQPGVRKALNLTQFPDPPGVVPPTTTQNPRVVDVNGTSRTSSKPSAGPIYQAPGSTRFAPSSAKQASFSTTSSPEPAPSASSSGLYDSVAKSTNALGDWWDTKKAQAKGMMNQQGKQQSRTRSNEYLKRAQRYEQEWQKRNSRGR